MSEIKCMVEECTYNSSFKCAANAIEVKSNGTRVVNTSENTACDTFKPRG